MKIIFVDIDGPLLPARAWLLPGNQKLLSEVSTYGHPFGHPELHKTVQFDPVAINIFNMWFEDPEVHAVISSNWYHYMPRKDAFEAIFTNNGMNIRFHENWVTPRKITSNRLIEISWWLEKNEYDNYMIVDDDPTLVQSHSSVVFDDLDDHLLYVKYSDGISGSQFFRGCKILDIPREYNLPHLTFQGSDY